MRSYSHFTLTQRETLCQCLIDGMSQAAIGRKLGKSRSSISRELKRNRNQDGNYTAWRGMCLYLMRRKKSRRKRVMETDSPCKAFVEAGLEKRWSPEIIVNRWKREHENAKLSVNTIYAAIRNGSMKGVKAKTHLRRHGRRKHHNSRTIKPERTIEQRDEIINMRGRIGDCEGDTVHGAIGKGALFTCVDRKSRMLYAAKLKTLEAAETGQAMIEALKEQNIKSLTLDNGSEFAQFRQVEAALGAPIYFAHPHSPWERGSNENLNGLLRFFFPKGTNFLEVSEDRVDEVVSIINDRPRKCLDWLSPREFLAACCT